MPMRPISSIYIYSTQTVETTQQVFTKFFRIYLIDFHQTFVICLSRQKLEQFGALSGNSY